MARLPAASIGSIVTESQLAHLFPDLLLGGVELELGIENGKFTAHMGGFYSIEDLHAITMDVSRCNAFFGDFMAVWEPVAERLDKLNIPRTRVRDELMWDLMIMERFKHADDHLRGKLL
jgi:hypothetical protein